MIVVSGGTGLLGAHLLFRASAENVPIRAIYRSKERLESVRKLFQFYAPDNWEEQFARIEWHKGDLLDVPFLEEVMQDCAEVYHCAAVVSFHRRDFNRMIKINREGTFNMVNVALASGVKKFCHVSSTAAIGGTDSDLITEESHWKNTPTTSGYSISKYSAEKEVWRAKEEGLNVVIVNPCVILGPGRWNESSLTLFRTLQKGLKYYPPGSNATVDARDVAEIMVRLMAENHFGERYLCIGSNQNFHDLMGIVAKRLGVRAPSVPAKRYQVNFVRRILGFWAFLTGKRNEMTRDTVNNLFGQRAYDASKVKKTLNFEFKSLEDTIDNAVRGRMD